ALYLSSVEDSASEISVPVDGTIVKRHPQRLRTTFSPQDAESKLGIPDKNISDFRGGQHLSWVGTAHTLQAAFDAGRLYYISLEDRATGHGGGVYASFDLWGPYGSQVLDAGLGLGRELIELGLDEKVEQHRIKKLRLHFAGDDIQ